MVVRDRKTKTRAFPYAQKSPGSSSICFGLVLFDYTSRVRRVDNHKPITVLEIIIVIKHLLSSTCVNGNFSVCITLMCQTSSSLKQSLQNILMVQTQM